MVANFLFALACSQAEIQKDIIYRDLDGSQIKADFYPPALRNPDGDPMVIVIHGGAWVGGQRQDMALVCENLAKYGFASATISYRLAPQSKYPAMLDDVQGAVRYFRANAKKYGINTTKMGALGASAGGHLALLLGFTDTRDATAKDNPTQSSRVQAVVNFFGPVDLSKDFNTAVASYLSMQVTGKQYDPAGEAIKSFSPITFIDKKSAPVFTIQGDADTTVPPKQANRLDDAMKVVGVEHTLRVIPGMGHEIKLTIPECDKAVKESVEFLTKQLMGEKSISKWL
ncbi:MAG: alpha/beta hydrolase [Fimbriimonadaceae bacterium]|nr:MAG: alpha/beta hydrolase [Fimbriimonadaceae bacterium]